MTTVKVTPAMVRRALQETDWAAIDAQTDEDIARNVASDPDAAQLPSEDDAAAGLADAFKYTVGWQ